jgi:hypothetical protein
MEGKAIAVDLAANFELTGMVPANRSGLDRLSFSMTNTALLGIRAPMPPPAA